MAPPLIFFSDAHLGAPLLDDDKVREKKVIELLEYAAGLDATIYIVGDLFEFWFEYKQAIPKKNFALLAKLFQLTSCGAEIHYFAGNHDMWLGAFLHDELGLITHQNETRVRYDRFDILVTHGDGVAGSDTGYRLLKRIFRNKLNIALYRLIHPDFGIPFAKKMSQVSRIKSFSVDPRAKEYREFALNAFEQGPGVVIMGHTHEAKHEIFADKHYINLGDWISHYSYCQIQGDGITIRQWPSKEQYVRPVIYKEIPVNGHQLIAGAVVEK